MHKLFAALFSLCLAAPAAAHPHIFVDTGLVGIFDDTGALTHVRVTWHYDDLYSLLITEDYELDTDYDGVLTPAEIDILTGFDMRWVEGFAGDLEVTQEGRALTLSGPQEVTASFDEGRITTTHLRAVTGAEPGAAPIVIKPYDPTYYTAYDVTLPVAIQGAPQCRSRVTMPDVNASTRDIQQQLSTLDAGADPVDVGLPNIGAMMANEVIFTCSAS